MHTAQRAPVYADGLARDVAGLHGAEEGAGGADFFGPADPARRHGLPHLPEVVSVDLAHAVGEDRAGRDVVDGHSEGGGLDRERLRHRGDRWAEGVREDEVGDRLPDRDRSYVDDAPPTRLL